MAAVFNPGDWTTVGGVKLHVPDELKARFPGLSHEAYEVLLGMGTREHFTDVKERGRGSSCYLMVTTSPSGETTEWGCTRQYQREIGPGAYQFSRKTFVFPKEMCTTHLSDGAWRILWTFLRSGLKIAKAEEIVSYDDDRGEQAELFDLTVTFADGTTEEFHRVGIKFHPLRLFH